MKKKIKDIKTEKVPLREFGDIKSLAESIQKHGLLQPVVINQDNELVAGRRRLEAHKMLGVEEIEVTVVNTLDDYDHLAKSLVENVQRKNLSWQEEIKFLQELDQIMRARYGSATQGTRTDLTEEKPWTSEDTAALVRKGSGRIREKLALAENLDKYPELGDSRTESEAVRKMRKIKKLEEIKKKERVKGVYDVVNVNPRWFYPNAGGMSVDDIKEISLPLADDSIVFLWTTVGYLPDAFDVLEVWGLEYKNLITWRKNIGGMGHWGRVVTEHCLMGIKGKPVADFSKMSNFVEGEKSNGGKPAEFYEMIEEHCPGRKLDMFGEKKRKKWDILVEV